ncbi:hypothetical protein CB1_000611001 [Camelus ferus]|nr:hypothetical protein CB1_000611001 [Camelus ferus]
MLRSARPSGQSGPNGCALFQFLFLSEVLQWRAQTTPDHVLYTLLNCRVSTEIVWPTVASISGGFPDVEAATA